MYLRKVAEVAAVAEKSPPLPPQAPSPPPYVFAYCHRLGIFAEYLVASKQQLAGRPLNGIFDNLVEIHVYFLDSADERSEC